MPGPQDDWAAWDSTTQPLHLRGAPRRSGLPPLPQSQQRSVDMLARPPYTPEVPPRLGRTGGPAAPKRRKGRALGIVLLVVLLLALFGGVALAHRAYDFGTAISNQGPFTTQTGFMSGVDRMNVLVMGYGGAGHDGADLTDSMMVISVVPSSGATTMISVPRDLWVQVPPNSGQYAKLNTAFQDGVQNGYSGLSAGRLAGGAEAAQKVSDVLGIPVTSWVTLDFQGFRSLVDALGGVDINVPTAFTANYPKNDNPQIDAGWKTIQFKTGLQHMDGERAIEYARARYVLTPASEGSDFARSVRQQILVKAILSRARQVSAWPSLLNATTALQQAIFTNLSLADLALFAEKMDFSHAERIGLSNDNVLTGAQSSDGQAILLPQNGNWDAIKQYVAAHLKG